MPQSRGRRPKQAQASSLSRRPERPYLPTGKTAGVIAPERPNLLAKISGVVRYMWAWILGLSALVSLAAAAVFFLPRVTVDASGPFEASPRPPITFTIANTNVVPLENIKPLLGLCAMSLNFGMKDDNPTPPFNKCNGESKGYLSPTNWHYSRLAMDEKITASWDDAVHNQTPGDVDYADVIITVSYQPWFLPLTRYKTFRFVTHELGDGKIYWLARPLTN
jgi:hypothetical protein